MGNSANPTLTGKQRKFIECYLGPANFIASKAAAMAGYRGQDAHSLHSIGTQLLDKEHIRKKIDEFFAGAHVSAEETLQELAKLARGNSKDKIKALALLSQHHGLLDGRWERKSNDGKVELVVRYETDKMAGKMADDWSKQLDQMNELKEQQWQAVLEKYKDQPVAIEALQTLERVMKKGEDDEIKRLREQMQAQGKQSFRQYNYQPQEKPKQESVEAEIVHVPLPPTRRLPAAPIERMLADVEVIDIEPEPQHNGAKSYQPKLCKHGNPPGQCHTIDVSAERRCEHFYRDNSTATPPASWVV